MGNFGFSYIGLIFLTMLIVPNLIWIKLKPEGYSAKNENGILSAFEKFGQAAVTCTSLIFSDYNPKEFSVWTLWLIAAAFVMVLYEIWWIRYFVGDRKLSDFYRSFFGIPVAGATLPVAAFLLLGIYGKVIWLAVSAVILGIGHIGIHLGHKKEIEKAI